MIVLVVASLALISVMAIAVTGLAVKLYLMEMHVVLLEVQAGKLPEKVQFPTFPPVVINAPQSPPHVNLRL